ncbi:HAMP domain-containing sensor histidine kinase [Streptomyces sp. NPDC021622]|uniref:sensor histidine kinase n=1 Tax=Streptomyces sp. NPDC021622 TaxID=3155013 RepID=UPI00341186AC
MRRRLRLTYVLLIGALLGALAVPLGLAYAQQRTHQLLLDRRADATHLAGLAEQAVREGGPAEADLAAEVRRYTWLYDAGAEVRDATGEVLAAGGGVGDGARDARHGALAGRTTERLPLVTPFAPRRVTVAEPAGRDAQVVGTVLLVAPADAARRDVALVWAALAGGAVAMFAAAYVAAGRLARWTLRPVAELDAATEAIAAGQLHARAPVGGSGPSELRRLEERFNAMADTVAAVVERQRAFVADASHELRTPLAVLTLRVENLRSELTDPGSQDYERALDEIDRLSALLDDLLALAQVESGTPAAVEPVEVVGEVRPRLDAWSEVAEARGIDFAVRLPGELAARCVPQTAGRVLDVAVDNALKFTPEGGRVEVSLAEAAGEVVLRVADDGPGLPPDELAVARDRFWRSPRHSNVDGSGLGLALADELARASGGSLDLLPREPRGLVVRLRLPLERSEARQ